MTFNERNLLISIGLLMQLEWNERPPNMPKEMLDKSLEDIGPIVRIM